MEGACIYNVQASLFAAAMSSCVFPLIAPVLLLVLQLGPPFGYNLNRATQLKIIPWDLATSLSLTRMASVLR